MSDVNKDYLTEEYPHSVDDRAAAVEQRPTFFDFDDPYGDDPMIYLKEGWHGLGSLTELAFISGGSIVGSGTSLQFTSNVEVTGSLTVGGAVTMTSSLEVTGSLTLGEDDTSWTTVTSLDNNWTGTVRYIRRAGLMSIKLDLDASSASNNTVTTLPSGYRPDNPDTFGVVFDSINGAIRAYVNTSGEIRLFNYSDDVQGSITYPVL